MTNLQIDPRPYFQLLHAMLRVSSSDAEIERTNRVMDWWMTNRKVVETVCTRDEMGLLAQVAKCWIDFKTTPTSVTLRTRVEGVPQPKVLFDLLDGYDKCEDYLQTLTHADMDLHLAERIKDYETLETVAMYTQAATIATGSIPNPAGTKFKPLPPLSGARDAQAYVAERMAKGILVNEVRPLGGKLGGNGWRSIEQYRIDAIAKAAGKLTIPTGIAIIDEVMHGLHRREVTGVLGFGGQRKTAIVRTMAYNAAKAGFRVLHIPVETNYMEELIAYQIVHAHAQGTFHLPNISVSRRREIELTRQELNTFHGDVIPDFDAGVGENLRVFGLADDQYTWEAVRGIIVRENAKEPIDLVVVDYLTLIGDSSDRDHIQKVSAMVRDVKRLTLNSPGDGFAFVTPIQGNRKGYEEAQENGGMWDTTGIFQYSELDKSMDNCLYVYTDDALAADGKLKLGSCKHRRGANLPSTFVEMHANSGMVGLTKSGSFTVSPVATAPADQVKYSAEEYYSWGVPL